MIEIEGYKAFYGSMGITPANNRSPFVLVGEFLYKPDTQCWYHEGKSYSNEVCHVLDDNSIYK